MYKLICKKNEGVANYLAICKNVGRGQLHLIKMAVRRKGWRQAACMILAVGPYRYLNRQLLRPVAETASLPVCMTVEKEKADGAEHCELLFVKRNSKTKFMVCARGVQQCMLWGLVDWGSC